MDIVERLRDDESMYDADDVDLHLDAADEIERLRGIINDDRLEGAADEIEQLRQILGLLCIGLEQGKPLFGHQDLISCRHSKLAVEEALGYFKDKATGGE